MATIAVINRKGGVGKSTVCAHLGAELNSYAPTALLDADAEERSLVAWANLGAGVLADIVRPLDIDNPQSFKYALSAIAKNHTHIVIDTPPQNADAAIMAALVADVVVIPTGPSPLEIRATANVIELIRDDVRGVIAGLPYQVEARDQLSETLAPTLASLGVAVLPAVKRARAAKQATLEGLTLFEYGHSSEIRKQFKALAKAVLDLVE